MASKVWEPGRSRQGAVRGGRGHSHPCPLTAPWPTGDLCEHEENPCRLREPCLHGGVCQGTRCLCPPGFSGPRCQQGNCPGLSPPPSWGPLGLDVAPTVSVLTDCTPPFLVGSGQGTAESDWHLEGSGGNGMYFLWPERLGSSLASGLSAPLPGTPHPQFWPISRTSTWEAHWAQRDRTKKSTATQSRVLPCTYWLGDLGQVLEPL